MAATRGDHVLLYLFFTHKNGDQVFNPRAAGWSSGIRGRGGKRSNKHLHSVLTISNIHAHTYTYLETNIYVKYTHTQIPPLTPYMYPFSVKNAFRQGESERPSIICAKRALYVRSASRCAVVAALLFIPARRPAVTSPDTAAVYTL